MDKREVPYILPTFHPTLRNITNYVLLARAVVVAQVVAHRLRIERSQIRFPPGSWAFFSSLSYRKCVLNQVPRGGASQLIFLFKMLSSAA